MGCLEVSGVPVLYIGRTIPKGTKCYIFVVVSGMVLPKSPTVFKLHKVVKSLGLREGKNTVNP
jgi:hypothetical protein